MSVAITKTPKGLADRRGIPWNKKISWSQVTAFGVIHLLALTALFFPSWQGLLMVLLLQALTGGLGISLGYHRLLSHKAFATSPQVLTTLALFGALALQGGPLRWAALHRAHHRYPDQTGDPHARSRGFGWAHCGWVFFKAPNGYRFRHLEKQVPDLLKFPGLVFIERHYLTINAAFVLLALLFLGWQLTLWAIFLRVVLVWHCTWMVNSLCHSGPTGEGSDRSDSSCNKRWLAWLTYGEGLHHNHHREPANARFGSLREGDLAGALVPFLET